MSLEQIIEHNLQAAGISGSYFYFVSGEPEGGKISIDLFFKATYSKLPRIKAYFSQGFYIDGEYWHMIDRMFSAGDNGNADFGCTLIRGRVDDTALQRLARKKVFVY